MIFTGILIFLLVLILISIILFSFKRFSPVPYFPSNKIDLHLIIKALDLKNNQTLIDLGAGDGIIIFAAARKALEKNLNTQFVAIDINPILIFILHLRRFFHKNKKSIKIISADMFNTPLTTYTQRSVHIGNKETLNVTVYLYISPWFL